MTQQPAIVFPDFVHEYWKSLDIRNFPTEAWVAISGFKNYQISNLGRIKTLEIRRRTRGVTIAITPPKIRKQQINRTGYLVCTLNDDCGVPYTKQVHQMVGIEFIDNPEKRPCINHKNFIRTDNRVENLEWCTNKENSAHASERYLRGTNSFLSKLTEKDVLEVFYSPDTLSKIAQKYSVDKRTVIRIKNKKVWKHVLCNLGASTKNKMPYKLNMQTADLIRSEYSTGKFTQRQLAFKYNIGKTQVGSIINNKRWKI
jgi:hypothetical protein